MSYNYGQMSNLQESLSEYASIETSSISSAVGAVCEIASYPDYISEPFLNAVILEMERMLQFYKENTEIVHSTETVIHTNTTLEWYD